MSIIHKMIHYHGCTRGTEEMLKILKGRHILVSFAARSNLATAVDICQSFCLDNGAFTTWKRGKSFNKEGYARWVNEWRQHPAFDWALIPDVIDGSEEENNALLSWWLKQPVRHAGIPIWHMHESIQRLKHLATSYSTIALGSSAQYAAVGNAAWWSRMAEAMGACCDMQGRPLCKIHGLRMLDPEIFRYLPLAFADSTNVARNTWPDDKWSGRGKDSTPIGRGTLIAEFIEQYQSAAIWSPQAIYQAAGSAVARRLALRQMSKSLCS